MVDLAVEIPILASGLYDYYGDPPVEVFGLPLYWLFMNIAVPVSLDVTGSVPTGWPVFSALHAQASMPVKYLCALLTVAIGVVALDATIRYGVRAARSTAAPEVTAVRA